MFGEGEKTTAERPILVSEVEWLHLHMPVLINPGETYWVDLESSSLIVEDQDGHRQSFPASWPGGPDARR